MSINACSINSSTIDSICGARRNAIIFDLQSRLPVPPPVETVIPHHPQHVSGDTRVPLSIFRRTRHEDIEEDIDIASLELPQITISVELNGLTTSHTLERDNGIPLVTVYAVSLGKTEEISVSSDDLKIAIRADLDQQVNIVDLSLKVI